MSAQASCGVQAAYDCATMCGRYVLTDLEKFLQRQQWIKPPEPGMFPAARFNIAPTQEVAAVVRDKGEADSGVLKPFRWGLVPSWAKDESIGSRMCNARSETVNEKASFKRALAKRRCLIPADGFYEWKKPSERRGGKQPYSIRLKNDQPFAFAGLWEVWRDPLQEERPPLFTCTIITCPPNPLVAELHDRMPVILAESAYRDWLDIERIDAQAAQGLLKPYPADQMYAYPVDRRVGNVGHDDPTLLEQASGDSGAEEVAGGSPSLF